MKSSQAPWPNSAIHQAVLGKDATELSLCWAAGFFMGRVRPVLKVRTLDFLNENLHISPAQVSMERKPAEMNRDFLAPTNPDDTAIA